jgi:AAA-like domain
MSRVLAPERFYQVGGTMRADAPSYVQRQADHDLLAHTAAGDFCYVLTPRQMGKSSLVIRTAAQLRKKRIRSVMMDLQQKTAHGMNAETFYAGLLDAFIRQLQLPVELSRWWQEQALFSAVQRFTNFVVDEVLPRVPRRLVVFIDEIDATLRLEFSDDFFAAIRAFYNDRAWHPLCKRLTFVLVGVASPSDLIKDRTCSPFNIGHRIELTDFTLEEAGKLIEGFPGDGQAAKRLLQRILDWTGGQPYLTQKVCAELATDEKFSAGEARVESLIQQLFFSDAPWSDVNLSQIRDRLVEDKDHAAALLALYRRIRAGEQIFDDERSPLHAALKLSGLVKVIPGGVLRPRNRIYEDIFDLQ